MTANVKKAEELPLSERAMNDYKIVEHADGKSVLHGPDGEPKVQCRPGYIMDL